MKESLDARALMKEIKQGSLAATAFLDREIQPMVREITARHFNLGHQYDDLWQEIALKVWDKLDTCRADTVAGLKGWVRAITYNHCRNVRRSLRRAELVPLDEAPDALDLPDPQDPVSDHEGVEALERRLDEALTNRLQKDVIKLRHIEGLDVGEIAEELNLPVNTVRSALHRGMEKLRDYYRDLHEMAEKKVSE